MDRERVTLAMPFPNGVYLARQRAMRTALNVRTLSHLSTTLLATCVVGALVTVGCGLANSFVAAEQATDRGEIGSVRVHVIRR